MGLRPESFGRLPVEDALTILLCGAVAAGTGELVRQATTGESVRISEVVVFSRHSGYQHGHQLREDKIGVLDRTRV